MEQIRSQFSIAYVNIGCVILIDSGKGMSITNDAEAVIRYVDQLLHGGLDNRYLFYRDTQGRFDMIKHRGGRFAGFELCSEARQGILEQLCRGRTIDEYETRITD